MFISSWTVHRSTTISRNQRRNFTGRGRDVIWKYEWSVNAAATEHDSHEHQYYYTRTQAGGRASNHGRDDVQPDKALNLLGDRLTINLIVYHNANTSLYAICLHAASAFDSIATNNLWSIPHGVEPCHMSSSVFVGICISRKITFFHLHLWWIATKTILPLTGL